MNFIDLFSLALHQAVAERLLVDDDNVLQVAQNNLKRWLENGSFSGSEKNGLLEWHSILENSTSAQIRKIITQDNDEGQRLRSSSPFVGVLSESEREKIWSECAEIQPL